MADADIESKVESKVDGDVAAPASESKVDGDVAVPASESKDKKSKGKGKSKGSKGKGGRSSYDGYRLNVKHLADEIATADKLKELFAPFGTVSSAEVKTRDDGSSRGFGYVVLKDEAEGKAAIEVLNGKEFGGKNIDVGPAERRPQADDGKGYDGKGYGKGMGKKGQDSWQAQQMYAAAYMNYMYMMQSSYAQQWAGGDSGSGEVTYEGSLKSISAKNGYGFVVCAETYNLYGRDIYIDKEILPEGAKPTDRIKFTVALNAKNHPKAVTASFAVSK